MNEKVNVPMDKELAEEFREFLRAKKEKIDSWEKEMDKVIHRNEKTPLPPKDLFSPSENHLHSIVAVFGKSGKWLSNGEIRERMLKLKNIEMNRITLRDYLVAHEDTRFRRKGKTRTTKWKLIENV